MSGPGGGSRRSLYSRWREPGEQHCRRTKSGVASNLGDLTELADLVTNVKNEVITPGQSVWSDMPAGPSRAGDTAVRSGRSGGGTLPVMRLIEVVRRPNPSERDRFVGFVDAITATTGSRPLSDHLWLDLRAGGGDGFHAVRISNGDATHALAVIVAANEGAVLEVVVDPSASDIGDPRAVRDTAADAEQLGERRIEVSNAKGHPDNPVSDEELKDKFRHNASLAKVAATDREALIALVWALDDEADAASALWGLIDRS